MHISYFTNDVQQSVDFPYHYTNEIIAIICPIIYKVFMLKKTKQGNCVNLPPPQREEEENI